MGDFSYECREKVSIDNCSERDVEVVRHGMMLLNKGDVEALSKNKLRELSLNFART